MRERRGGQVDCRAVPLRTRHPVLKCAISLSVLEAHGGIDRCNPLSRGKGGRRLPVSANARNRPSAGRVCGGMQRCHLCLKAQRCLDEKNVELCAECFSLRIERLCGVRVEHSVIDITQSMDRRGSNGTSGNWACVRPDSRVSRQSARRSRWRKAARQLHDQIMKNRFICSGWTLLRHADAIPTFRLPSPRGPHRLLPPRSNEPTKPSRGAPNRDKINNLRRLLACSSSHQQPRKRARSRR